METTQDYRVIQYYKFVDVADPTATLNEQRLFCKRHGLLGRIYIAEEGINGTLSGPAEDIQAYMAFMDTHALFNDILWKVHDSTGHTFVKLVAKHKPELVNFRAPREIDPINGAGGYVDPDEMQHVLREEPEDTIIVDARSRYEYEVGRFKNALTLDIENFRELPEQLEALKQHTDKRVITYCTGGIKCEKLTAYLRDEGFDNVEQLHGGILGYAEHTGGEDFEGQCYVFDDRVTVPVNTVNPKVIGECENCGAPTERALNCANAQCHKRTLLCDVCAEELQGTCSTECYHSPHRRPWDGTGLYHKAGRLSAAQKARLKTEL